MSKMIMIDNWGNVISEDTRTKSSDPYSYDPIIQYKRDGDPKGSVHTDHLFREDPEKYNQLSQKYFGNHGQYFDQRDPVLIEAFLQEWLNKPTLSLCQVTECCNHSSGFPYWRLDYF